jgi:phage terminase large subunit-like protein
VKAVIARARWIKTARAEQVTPKGKWRIWLILAGRGWGKTRTGAEDVAAYALWHPRVRVGVIAPTFADARDVCVEGESGLLSVLPPECVKGWYRSTGELALVNGSRIKIFSADQPERLRGPQHHRVWCDELGAWGSRGAFDQMMFGLRLGRDPRVVVTTTPRNTEIVRELMSRVGDDVLLTRGRTIENEAHLASCVLEQLRARYDGTRLGRQELDAELLEDTEGALWTRELIEKRRVDCAQDLVRVVVAVDPALSYGAASDETGIVAAGLGTDGVVYVLADWSCRASPEMWARKVLALYDEVGADLVVAEVNAGGALVERLLRQVREGVVYKPVRALRGKFERALPVAALYEQGRVRHVGMMVGLEDQMARFSPLYIGGKSPDRVDALVWAVTELSVRRGAEPRVRSV